MAKVKIQGHASGTGILTVTAPNTSTDRTITLPDATGTLLNSDGSAASLTSIPAANITGTLPAISATNLTNVPAANITGTLPAIDGSSLTDVNAVNGGRKNMIINGAMNVAQRGTSTTGVGTTDFFACDRVKLFAGGGSSSSRYTVTQSTDSPTGFNYSYKIDCTTANASPSAGHYTLMRLGIIEKQDLVNTKFGTSSAESLTLSFWVKSNITGSQQALIVSHTNQKQAGDTFTINSADTWEKKTITVSGDTVNGFDTTNPTSLSITVDMFLEAGSNYYGGTAQGTTWGDRTNNTKAVNRLNISSSTSNYINITGVQLELGSIATDFEYRSYGEELALCQRYYQRIERASGDFYIMASKGQSTTTTRFAQTLTVPLRASPTISQGGGIGTWRVFRPTQAVITSSNTPSVVGFVENAGFVSLELGGFSGITDNYFYGTSPSFASSGYFDMDSEL
jgi:hypothetical protein